MYEGGGGGGRYDKLFKEYYIILFNFAVSLVVQEGGGEGGGGGGRGGGGGGGGGRGRGRRHDKTFQRIL